MRTTALMTLTAALLAVGLAAPGDPGSSPEEPTISAAPAPTARVFDPSLRKDKE